MIPDKAERARLAKLAAEQAVSWVESVEPGTRGVYHEGFLLWDREGDPSADGTAAVLYESAQRGLVYLTQKRVGPEHYIYYVTRAVRVLKLGKVR